MLRLNQYFFKEPPRRNQSKTVN